MGMCRSMRLTTLLILFVAFAVKSSYGNHWREFRSVEHHFLVRFPASWNRLVDRSGKPLTNEALEIISFSNADRVKGVVINSSGAEIQVGVSPKDVHTVEDWISHNLQDDIVLDRREVAIRKSVPNGCKRLTRITWRSDVSGGGKAFLFYTGYYCSTDAGLYRILLTNWEGNKAMGKFQDVALQVALSLRSWP